MGYTPNVNLTYNQGAGTFIKEEIVTNVSKTQYFGKVNSDKTRTYIKQAWKWGNTASMKDRPRFDWIFERWDYFDNTTVNALGLGASFQIKLNDNAMAQITGTGAEFKAIELAPSNLSYLEKCQWYEQRIISAIKNITDLAIQLGEDPEKVEKALVYASQSITQIATVINPVAGAVASAVSGIITILDSFDVFSGSAKSEYLKAKEQYNISNFVLTRWYEEYAICIKRFHEIDEIEFNNYVSKLKASTAVSKTNTGTNMGVFASLQSFVSDNLWVTAIIILLVVIVVTQYRKNKKGTKK